MKKKMDKSSYSEIRDGFESAFKFPIAANYKSIGRYVGEAWNVCFDTFRV